MGCITVIAQEGLATCDDPRFPAPKGVTVPARIITWLVVLSEEVEKEEPSRDAHVICLGDEGLDGSGSLPALSLSLSLSLCVALNVSQV